MILNKILFLQGPLDTVAERLCRTMDSMDRSWSQKVEPATREQIEALWRLSGLEERGQPIPAVYRLFLESSRSGTAFPSRTSTPCWRCTPIPEMTS